MYSTDFKSLIKKLPKNKENDLVLINWMIDQEFEILGYLLSALKEVEERSFTGIKNEETDKAFLIYWTAGKVYGSLTVLVVSFSEKIIFSLKESGYALNFLYANNKKHLDKELLIKLFENKDIDKIELFDKMRLLNNSFKHNAGIAKAQLECYGYKKDQEIDFSTINRDIELKVLKDFLISLVEKVIFYEGKQ